MSGLRTRVGWEVRTLEIYGNIGRYPVYSPLVIPPKDAQIGIRQAGGGTTEGETDWMPATVESFDGRRVHVIGPTNGARTAFWIEDARFYHHRGLDYRGITRAVWLLATSNEARVPGGSTITQQVAKNFYLSSEYSYSRKLMEWHYWLVTVGIVLFMVSLWIAGLIQGISWMNTNIPFIQTVDAMNPFFLGRLVGGVLVAAGVLLFVFNVWSMSRQPAAVGAALPAVSVVPGEGSRA